MSASRKHLFGVDPNRTLTFEQIEAALDAGKLEMIRPQGDWVLVRRCGRTVRWEYLGECVRTIPVFMENQVEAAVSTESAQFGFPDVRIVA